MIKCINSRHTSMREVEVGYERVQGLDKTPILRFNVKHLWKEKFLVSFLCSAFARAF